MTFVRSILSGLLFGALAAATPAQAKDILTGGSFETGTAGWEDTLWRYNGTSDVAGTIALDSTTAHGGTKSLKVSVTKTDGTNWHLRMYLPSFEAVRGSTYHLSFWARSAASATLNLGIDSVTKYKSSSGFTTTTAWKQYKFSYTAAASGKGAVTFSVYLPSTGDFWFDDVAIDEEAAVVLRDEMVQPDRGAWYTGRYRNLFVERGYHADTVQNRLRRAYEQLFFSTDTASEAIYFKVPTDTSMAYILAKDPNNAANTDIRSEGQSYGMIISVMMNRQDVFDKLWKFAKTYSQHKSDSNDLQGLFRWSLLPDAPFKHRGTYGYTPAPDGEEYYVTALFLASKRWGDGAGWYDYATQADSLLYHMRRKRKNNFSPLDSASGMILFSATNGVKFTDASYHLPAFYRLWAAFSKNADTAFYRSMADTSIAFWKRHLNDSTGLCTEYADFDGTPHRSGNSGTTFNGQYFVYDTVYHSDSHRTSMNLAMDWAWFMADPWLKTMVRKQLGFFHRMGGATSYKQTYSRTGTPLSAYSASQSQIGSNGAAVLASDTARDWAFVDALYGIGTPSGNYRYYNGLIYLLGYLHASGNFVAWGSPGLTTTAVQPRPTRTASPLAIQLAGRSILVSRSQGPTVRLLDARGHVASEAKPVDGQTRLLAPKAGVWIVSSGNDHRTIAVP